jgi:macrolide transport system ATP-binding/permease protein
VGFVFQQFHLLPRVSARVNVQLPLIYAGRSAEREKAREKIAEVGLADRARHHPNELSGGEQQRIAIARALVNDPLIIMADEPTGNLDSVSEEEIITLLEKLNREGKTVVMVTHERSLAGRAGRIITMRDGEIVSDEKTGRVEPSLETGSTDISLNGVLAGGGSEKAMVSDYFRQAFFAVFSHKTRALLSMLGILIGVGAVIAMMALGEGAKESISKRLASLGSNLLMVRPGSRKVRHVALGAGEVTRFTLKDAGAMRQLPTVARVSPAVSGRGQLVYGDKNWNTYLRGTDVDYAPMRDSVPTVGRFFTREEERKRAKVADLGTTVARELFGENNPVGKTIKINRINFRVIGVLPRKGSNPWRDRDDVVIIPISTAMYRVLGKDYVSSIDVEVGSSRLMGEAEREIRELIVKRHHLRPDQTDTFQIRNMAEIRETIESTTKTMSWLLGAIAAISLLVGGIGIMNIMLVSVTERTREIGLRKALGARKKDVMTQFLIEAVLLTISGGLAGILLGGGIAFLMAGLADWAVKITPFSVFLAAGFSILIGLAFGIFPAHQASRLDPIEALRYE